MASYDDFLAKLNLLPPQADKMLRNIRRLDQTVQEKQLSLQQARTAFIEQLEKHGQPKTQQLIAQMNANYRSICRKEGEV